MEMFWLQLFNTAYQSEGGNWTPADISVHGHYAYSNLFEGNIVQEITVSDYWDLPVRTTHSLETE